MNLTPTDLAVHVSLGITPEMLDRAQVRRVDDGEAHDQLTSRHPGDLSGVLYPYLSPTTGYAPTCRMRRDHPEMENGKPKDKYLSAYGNRKHLYFPPDCAALLSDVTIALIIAEAEKSVLSITCAAERLGRPVLAVGTGGCWGWRGRKGKTEDANGARVDEVGPLPDLDDIAWKGRTVVIAFDANVATNLMVKYARRDLAKKLTARGAVVHVINLPTEEGINGPDDFIGLRGDEAFFALVDQATPGSGDAIAEAISRLNERFAIVSVENKVVVMETRSDGGIQTLWPFEEFRRLLVKEHIDLPALTRNGGPTTKRVPLANLWLTHRDGRQYRRLVYAMPGGAVRAEADDYNGWLGFTVEPRPGDWSRNRAHLHDIICAGNDDHFKWLFNWSAALVQLPGQHAFTSVVLRGGQGIGKGHYAHLMLGGCFFPQQYLHIIGAGMLTGRFNEHLSGKVLVFADESTWGGDPAAADKLKGMITESTVPIERKFLPLVEEPSALHIVIASNNEWPIAIPMDDRRFMVLDVAETKRQDDLYFGPLRAELRNGGLAAMLYDLLAHEVDEHALRHPLSTDAKIEVMGQSMKPIERWWHEKLQTGVLLGPVPDIDNTNSTYESWPKTVLKNALHEDYLEFVQKHNDNRTRRSTETELGMFLARGTGMGSSYRGWATGRRSSYWEFPSLAACRDAWAKACGWPEREPGEEG